MTACADAAPIPSVGVPVPHVSVPLGLGGVRRAVDRHHPVRPRVSELHAAPGGEADVEPDGEGTVRVCTVLLEVLPDDRGGGDTQHVHLRKCFRRQYMCGWLIGVD